MKLRDLFKKRVENVRMINCKIILHFTPKYGIHIPPQIGCVCETLGVERPRRLLKRRGTWRAGWGRCRWSGDDYERRLCNNIVDPVPDNAIRLIVEDCTEERYDPSYVKIPGIDG